MLAVKSYEKSVKEDLEILLEDSVIGRRDKYNSTHTEFHLNLYFSIGEKIHRMKFNLAKANQFIRRTDKNLKQR